MQAKRLDPIELKAGNRLRLRLDAAGFQTFKLFGSSTFRWAEVSDFHAFRAGARPFLRFTVLSGGQVKAVAMSRVLSGIGPDGRSITLQTPEELAGFVATYRELALQSD